MTEPVLAQAIVENALANAIFTLDYDGVILSWSPGAEQVVGYTADEAIGARFSTIFAVSDQVAGADRLELETAIREGRAEDTRWHLRKNGERFWANGVTMRLPTQDVLLKVMRDETRAKLAEDQRVLLLNELNHRIKNNRYVHSPNSLGDHGQRRGLPGTRGADRIEIRRSGAQAPTPLGKATKE